MSIFRKSAIGLAILGLAGSAYASTMSGVFIGVDALDMQPRNGDMDFVNLFPAADGGEVFTESVHPSFTWDFRLFGGIKFCGNDDLTISWTHFHTNNFNYDVADPTDGANVRWLDFASGTGWTDIFATVQYNLDDVSGVFGHTINLMAWNFRFAGGLEWTKLNTYMTVGATDTTGAFSNEAISDLHGFGPRVEFDMTYNMPWGFAAFAKTNAALLIANRHIELEATQPTTVTDIDSYDWSRRHVVVPKLGIKLGLSFGHVWGDVGGEGAVGSPTFVSLEAGWQAEAYIHAVERPEGFGNDDGLSATDQFSNLSTKTSNYAYEGLFVGVTFATSWF